MRCVVKKLSFAIAKTKAQVADPKERFSQDAAIMM